MKLWEKCAVEDARREDPGVEDAVYLTWKEFAETGDCTDIWCKRCPFLSATWCREIGAEERMMIELNKEVDICEK